MPYHPGSWNAKRMAQKREARQVMLDLTHHCEIADCDCIAFIPVDKGDILYVAHGDTGYCKELADRKLACTLSAGAGCPKLRKEVER